MAVGIISICFIALMIGLWKWSMNSHSFSERDSVKGNSKNVQPVMHKKEAVEPEEKKPAEKVPEEKKPAVSQTFKEAEQAEDQIAEEADPDMGQEISDGKKIVTRDGQLWDASNPQIVDFLLGVIIGIYFDLPDLGLREDIRKFYISKTGEIEDSVRAYQSKEHKNTANALAICLDFGITDKMRAYMKEEPVIYAAFWSAATLIGQIICDDFEVEYPTDLFDKDREKLVEDLYQSYESYREKYNRNKKSLGDRIQAYFKETVVGWDEFGFNEPYEGEIPEFINGVKLPDDYREFMKKSNGGEGDVGSTWLCLDRIEELLMLNRNPLDLDSFDDIKEFLKGKLLIGSDGSEELIGIDEKGRYFMIPDCFDEGCLAILGDRIENLPVEIQLYWDSMPD